MSSEPNPKRTRLVYKFADLRGMKTATIAKMANLSYDIEPNYEPDCEPHVLYTPSGELHK